MKLVTRLSLLVAVFVLAAVVLAGCSGQDGALTRSYYAPDPCQFTTLDLQPNPGVDLAAQGQTLIDGFVGVPAIGDVTFYPAKSQMEVTWCIESQTEQGVIAAVEKTGLAAITQATTVENSR